MRQIHKNSVQNTTVQSIQGEVIHTTPWSFMLQMAKPHRWWLFGAFSIVVVAAGLSQGSSYFFKLIVDAADTGDTSAVFLYALLFPIVILVVQLLFRSSGYLGMQCVTRMMKTSTEVIAAYSFQHSHNYFLNRFAGSIMTKYNNVVGAMGDIIPALLWTHVTALVSFLVTFAFIAFIDMRAAAAFIVLTLVLVLFNRSLASTKHRYSKAHAESRTKLSGRLIDILGNISAVRQFARVPSEFSALQVLTQDRYEKHQRNWWFTEKTLLANSVILSVFGLFMFWSLVSRWQASVISTGDLVLVLSLVSQITGTLIFIGRAINETARAFGEMEEGLEDIFIPYEIENPAEATPLKVTEGIIEWRDVTFMYEADMIFKDFNVTLRPHQRVGLVGPSGAGKTTFVSLLLRQHNLSGGQILIDNQDIAKVTQDSLREAIAIVPQEPALFHRTIRENIAYGNIHASDEAIVEVAKKAQAHEFISALPNGYETLVGERGVKLSGGQKQRIAIARAMLKNAPILVLDEATSALDSESEVAIQKALHALMEGKTVLAIAHRLSTLREMDRIIVLEAGRIVEDGNHDSLQDAGGTYQRLWTHQAGGFVGE